jgi:hypothetical protein
MQSYVIDGNSVLIDICRSGSSPYMYKPLQEKEPFYENRKTEALQSFKRVIVSGG